MLAALRSRLGLLLNARKCITRGKSRPIESRAQIQILCCSHVKCCGERPCGTFTCENCPIEADNFSFARAAKSFYLIQESSLNVTPIGAYLAGTLLVYFQNCHGVPMPPEMLLSNVEGLGAYGATLSSIIKYRQLYWNLTTVYNWRCVSSREITRGCNFHFKSSSHSGTQKHQRALVYLRRLASRHSCSE